MFEVILSDDVYRRRKREDRKSDGDELWIQQIGMSDTYFSPVETFTERRS